MVMSAAMTALALVLPPAFHAVGLGSQFLPLLLPVLLNGFLSTFGWAALAGAAAPLASSLLTGMPPLYPPVALVLSLEGAVLGGLAALIYRRTRPRILPAVIPAILCGRLLSFALTWFLARQLTLPAALASSAALLHGLPGVALQLTVVPLVVRSISKRQGILFSDESDRKTPLLR